MANPTEMKTKKRPQPTHKPLWKLLRKTKRKQLFASAKYHIRGVWPRKRFCFNSQLVSLSLSYTELLSMICMLIQHELACATLKTEICRGRKKIARSNHVVVICLPTNAFISNAVKLIFSSCWICLALEFRSIAYFQLIWCFIFTVFRLFLLFRLPFGCRFVSIS